MPKEEIKPLIVQKREPFEYTISYGPFATSRRKLHFSRKEIQDLLIAALLVVGVGLSFVWYSSPSLFFNYIIVGLFVIVFTLSFFLHEIAHKAVAQRDGLWAEFRLTLFGALLTLISALLPIKFISPGAVMIAGYADEKRTGKISIAGPLTNIVLSAAFLPSAFLRVQYVQVFVLGAAFNAWIALFNLIPFGIFDGLKVFHWSKKIWILAFTASLILTIISMSL
jgi:Zn-dependent protease